jgi:hypothetical protein
MALGLSILIVVMWLMVLAVAGFLVTFVAPVDVQFPNSIATSAVRAIIAVLAVIALIFGLGMLKKLYLQRKLT